MHIQRRGQFTFGGVGGRGAEEQEVERGVKEESGEGEEKGWDAAGVG